MSASYAVGRSPLARAAARPASSEQELRTRPWLARQVRVVETLGPSPIWPGVASSALPDSLVAQTRRALLAMHLTRSGRAVLAAAAMRHFVPVSDADYTPIREMAALAAARETTGGATTDRGAGSRQDRAWPALY